jgi:hypothetical protein
METTGSHNISIRLASEADQHNLIQLAALDSAPAPRGTILVAELDGDIVAAHSVTKARSIADPFRPTADARELLELRASQLPRKSRDLRRRHMPLSRRRAIGSHAVAA